MEMQKCLRCGEELPFTNEYFNYRNKSKNILAKHCKKCQKEYDKKSKEKDGNKTETITIKLTKKEKKQIEENAKKLDITVAQYSRYVLMKNRPIIIKNLIELEPIEKSIGDLIYQIKKIGNNLNQISKNLNQGGYIDNKTVLSIINVSEKLDKRVKLISNTIEKAYKNFD